MNKTEYYSRGNNAQNKYWRYTQKLLKEWMAKNNITEPCVVHHIDNEPDAIKYNNEHYELWGHEIDENGNLKFEFGKYVQFMTRVEHSRYHNTGEKNHRYGIPLSEDHKNKISLAKIGKHHSDETRKKISITKTGKPLSDECKKKLSLMNTGNGNPMWGKHHSAETIEKIRQNQPDFSNENNPMYGKHHTDEVKAKISAQQKGYSLLWDVYKNNNGTKPWPEFKHAVKTGDITFEMQPISVFIK